MGCEHLGRDDGTVHPLLTDAKSTTSEPVQAAAKAQAGKRYNAFVTALGRRLAQGPALRQEISEDVEVGPRQDN